jgi:hypothetical protein
MRGLAGVLALLAALGTLSPRFAWADYDHTIRELDREEFLEDEPIWLCSDPGDASSADLYAHDYRIVGVDEGGYRVDRSFHTHLPTGVGPTPRAFELGHTFDFALKDGRFGLFTQIGPIPAGRYVLKKANGDTTHVLARFRIVEPTGSERSVRDALTRAARLAYGKEDARAATLYDAVYRRYPRTTYLSMIYWGEWSVREHTRFAQDPGRWIEEIFAHFHDSCFGTIALDRWVKDIGVDEARPELRHLVGLYPDTPRSRAAARFL